MPAKKTPAKKPTKPRIRVVKPRPFDRFSWLIPVVLGIGVLVAIGLLVQWRLELDGQVNPQSTAHAAVVNYAQLIASEVCEEVSSQIDAAEAAGEPFTAMQAVKVIQDRGEEAREAAWKPVLDGFNKLQEEDGSIPYDKAREAVQTVRKGLEAVR